jgi:glucose/arabinose dehydrogenase
MKKLACSCALSLLLAIPFSGQSSAQNNMEKLQDFRQTGTELEIESVPQDAEKIETIRKNLERIQLPPGFKIDLYAIVPDARHMAVGTNVGVVFVGTRKTKVWAVTDRDKDRVADEVKQFAPSVKFKFPNGPVMSKEGVLYIAGHNRILAFPAAEFFYEGPDVAVAVVKDQFIPPEEEYFNHAFRVLDIGPDGKLYVTLGQPYNVFPADKMPMEPAGLDRPPQPGRDRVGGLCPRHPQLGRAGFPSRHRRALVQRQPSGRHGRRYSVRRVEPRAEPGPEFRFPMVRRRKHPDGRVQGHGAAGRHRLPGN